MKNHNEESPRGFSKKPLIIIAAAVIIAGGATAATVTAVNYANSPSRLVSLAQKFLNDSDYERAIIEFDKVLAMDPLNVDAYIGKAEALAALGRSDEALEVLATALDMVGSTATPEDISRIRELIDSIKGESPKMGTSEPVVTEEAATMESESESATPTGTEFIRTAVHADLSDGTTTDTSTRTGTTISKNTTMVMDISLTLRRSTVSIRTTLSQCARYITLHGITRTAC